MDLAINPKLESEKISSFIGSALKKTGIKNIVIGISGGIDSATSLYLISKVLNPKHIFIAHLYYFQSHLDLISPMLNNLKIPKQNQYLLSIQKPVDEFKKILLTRNSQNPPAPRIPPVAGEVGLTDNYKIRLGNIMARVRMITLFDLAKKHDALVCGTENKSEHLLGYFTRFGDAASDIEPITHLYKTQVFQLAKYLGVHQEIINAKPTAGLWADQTDEGEFGFSYREADQVLYQYFDQKIPLNNIDIRLFPNTEKIINFALKNSFKLKVPYGLRS